MKGLSENIRVVSIVGRFLEHHRIYSFHNNGDPLYYIGSSDWMPRNLRRRVEVATPVYSKAAKEQIKSLLMSCLADRVDAWEMRPDGRYHRPAMDTVGKDADCAIFDTDAYVSTDEEDPHATPMAQATPREALPPECLAAEFGTQDSLCEYYTRKERRAAKTSE